MPSRSWGRFRGAVAAGRVAAGAASPGAVACCLPPRRRTPCRRVEHRFAAACAQLRPTWRETSEPSGVGPPGAGPGREGASCAAPRGDSADPTRPAIRPTGVGVPAQPDSAPLNPTQLHSARLNSGSARLGSARPDSALLGMALAIPGARCSFAASDDCLSQRCRPESAKIYDDSGWTVRNMIH